MDRVIILCGLTCVGKTLAAEMLAEDFGFTHAEASAAMRSLWQASGGSDTLDEFAERSLAEDPSRVPRSIIEWATMERVQSLVVSGLRSPREVDAFIPLGVKVLLIVVCSPSAVRLQRCLARLRPGHPRDAKELSAIDLIHKRMGWGELVDRADACVVNDGSIDAYRLRLRALFD